jgi:tetratricopeptide (TPR) repeat protein
MPISILPTYGGNATELYPKSNAAARRALELLPSLAHPHAVLGGIEMVHDWDFAGGEAEFKKAFQLDPSDATAHLWYAESIGRLGGREQEAFTEANRVRELDRLSAVVSTLLGRLHIFVRQYDDAVIACKEVLNVTRHSPAHTFVWPKPIGENGCTRR